MSRSNMFRGLVSAAIAATMSLSGVAVTQQESRFTVNHVIHFTVPSDEQRAALSTRALLSASPPLASIIAEPFFIALEDLNDDGSEEIIVAAASSLNCGSGGCVVVVLEHRAGRTVALLDQNLYTPLAVTNEKIDGYRALASVDGAGAIAVSGKPGTPTSGLQLVYPMSLSRPQRTTQPAQAPVPPAVPRPAPRFAPGGPPVCGVQPFCTENLSFAATVTDFQAILQNTPMKTVTVRLAIRNKQDRPLILGYVNSSGVTTDDRGNRYVISGDQGVQGIGQIRGNQADEKFRLQPGETSDARFEFVWAGQNIFGVTFQVDMAIREIEVLPGNQIRLGREHALHFSGLADKMRSAPATTAPPSSPLPVGTAPPTASDTKDCGQNALCRTAGPFVAQVVGLTRSQLPTSAAQVVQVRVRFSNPAAAPIMLGYVRDTAVATDNFGRRYAVHFGTDGAKGMGIVDRSAADTQFVLPAGGWGEAAFAVSVVGNQRDLVGDTFNFDVTVAQLESLPGGQNRTVREYSLGFSGVSVVAIDSSTAAACTGKPRCYGEGPFVAEITGITRSVEGQRTPIDVRVQVRNVTSQPLILGYLADSVVIVDNYGQRYAVRQFGDGVRGIGEVDLNHADPQFVLKPGGSGNVTFVVSIVSCPPPGIASLALAARFTRICSA